MREKYYREKNCMPIKVINDFCITIGTVNGSGSATANTIILKSIFKMGIPVSGKNIFPSNIQGLPTWYSIRLNKDGFLGRVESEDILITMNPDSIERDLTYVSKGGVVLFNESIKITSDVGNLVLYPMPVDKILTECDCRPDLRTYLANMVYVGVLARIIGIDLIKINSALDQHFLGKTTAIEPNRKIIKKSYEWAQHNITKQDPFFAESMQTTKNYIMVDGNTAGALGSIYGGMQFMAWYPITPATSMPQTINEYLPKLRKDQETKKNTYVSIQAEDELAAIGMVVGAGWAGLRSVTATSGPGLCLMSEYLGLAYICEVPLVVWDVQRVGPSTGMPTRTSQGDLTFANFLSHGDTDYVILIPGSVQECFEFGWKALDIAEQLQTPVIVLSDLDLGMNQWMTPEFIYPETKVNRGKILWEEDLNKVLKKQKGKWGRYQDIDGDGIPYRTIPGNQHPRAAYFTRGTGHDEFAHYSEDPDVWERMHMRLHKKKMEQAKLIIPYPIRTTEKNTEIGIISYGSSDPAVIEACHLLRQKKKYSNYLRIRALPFTEHVERFLKQHSRVYVIETNRDGQMAQLLRLTYPAYAAQIHSVAHMDGLPLSAKWITRQVLNDEGK